MNDEGAKRLDSILVVDDDERNRLVLEGHLEGAGYAVTQADSGEAAIEALENRPFDLILLDVFMPGLDGFATCQRIRHTVPGGADVPILFVTAAGDLESYERAMAAGGDDFLPKPINRTELLLRVRSLLALKHYKDELSRGYQVIRSQRDALMKANQQREEMANLLVHDLKTPLQGIMTNAQYLQRTGLEGRPARAAERIVRSTELMTRMVTNLLDVARSEAGRLVPQVEPVALAQRIAEVVHDMAPRAEDRGQALSFRLQQDPGEVQADDEIMRRLMENLLDNALKYTPRGGRITVELVMPDPSSYEVRVSDDGPGIGEPYKERIFDKYVVLDRGQSQGEVRHGRGLGLVFCKMAVEAHGGRIWVTDNTPSGTSFRFRVPLAAGPSGAARDRG